MKNIIQIIVLSLILPMLATAQTDNVSVIVEGLGCPFCAFGLEKKFKKVDNIKNFRIDMETGETTFLVPSINKMSVEQVEKLVYDAGYSPIEITIDRAEGEDEYVKLELPKAEDANAEISFFVNGCCNMCKARIERVAYRSGGIGKADWSKKKKKLTIKYNDQMTDQATIEAAISQVGYDTENLRAADEAYDKLPECCQYKRKKQ